MTTWFIADTHFRHKNVLNFEDRPYDSIEEMEKSMINAWNAVVDKLDTVYIVGDFCFGKEKAWVEILKQLKGDIILIKGNHDHHKVIGKVLDSGYISQIYDVGKLIRLDKIELYITHFPVELGERPNRVNISGHIHSQESTYTDQLNVGVDSKFMKNYYEISEVPFGTPVSLEYLEGYISVLNEILLNSYKRG